MCQDEYEWNVKGFRDYFREGVEGCDPVDPAYLEDILRSALELLINDLKECGDIP